MDKTILADFRAKLEEIRFAITGEVNGKYKTKKNNPNEQMADIADEAAQSHGQQLMMEFGQKEWEKLRLVEEAIEKIDGGQYGICSECEELIPEGRLKVVPFAIHCVDCLDVLEKNTLT